MPFFHSWSSRYPKPLMAFLMAGTAHLLYRLLFEEVNSFLSGIGVSPHWSSPVSGLLLLPLFYVLYCSILGDDWKRPGRFLLPAAGRGSEGRSAGPVSGSLGRARALMMGALVGLACSLWVILISRFWPDSSNPGLPGLSEILAITLVTPTVEEAYYRLLLQGYLTLSLAHSGAGPRSQLLALLFSAACFLLSHDYFIAPVLLIPALAFGLVFIRWNALAAILSHAVYNAALIGGAYAISIHGSPF
ncbi:MAG: hypothetical protein CMN76_00575 [Spirochaetaceae bacterium]|nr:hypothetical protein [Spirochaetaceae bacterium]